MKNFKKQLVLISIVLAALFSTRSAQADYSQRLTLGAGVAYFNQPSKAYFEIGAEYEYRQSAMLGIGGFANYIFSTPSITLIGVPEVFFHPLAGEWYVSAAPLMEFASGMNTQFGARLGTRIPLPLGVFVLIPTFAIDFINGGQNLIFGLGIQF